MGYSQLIAIAYIGAVTLDRVDVWTLWSRMCGCRCRRRSRAINFFDSGRSWRGRRGRRGKARRIQGGGRGATGECFAVLLMCAIGELIVGLAHAAAPPAQASQERRHSVDGALVDRTNYGSIEVGSGRGKVGYVERAEDA